MFGGRFNRIFAMSILAALIAFAFLGTDQEEAAGIVALFYGLYLGGEGIGAATD